MAINYATLGATLVDLQAAYADRLSEANLAFQHNHFGTAMALGLYALEIYLKTRVCQRLDLAALPTAFQIHDLEGLLVLSGLKRRMEQLPANNRVKMNWDSLISIGDRHVNDLRYKPNTSWTSTEASELLASIQDSNSGVLPWLLAIP